MKTKIISAVLATAAAVGLPSPVHSKDNAGNETLTVISFNIRFGLAEDGENAWVHRKEATIDMIEKNSPDIIGMQEAFSFQIDYIADNCPGYGWVGKSRLDDKDAEHPVVFYDKRRFQLIDWGNFWLSDTPDRPSLGWDAAFERNVTWLLMKDRKSGRQFFFANTHLDHIGRTARKKGLEMILSELRKLNTEGLPVILTGDLNAQETDPALEVLCGKMLDARKSAVITDDFTTYNGWGNASESIDYIWYTGFTGCKEYKTVREQFGNIRYISDHYPIKAVLKL